MFANWAGLIYQKTTKIVLVCCLAEIGLLATLATGLSLTGQGWIGLTCIGFSNYGFPLAWRIIWSDCGYGIGLVETAFLLDVLFYMTIGYGLMIMYGKRSRISALWSRVTDLKPLKRIGPFLNIAGFMATIGSLAFPWYHIIVGNTFLSLFLFGPGLDSWVIAGLVVLGGGVSMISRYGGILTVAGCLLYSETGPFSLPLGASTVFGFGYWLAWEGAIISLIGRSWNSDLVNLITEGLGMKGRGSLSNCH